MTMENKHNADQIASAIFALSLAALAIFDFWFPGIVLVLGTVIIVRDHLMHHSPSRLGWGMVGIGYAFWLHDSLPQRVFPIAMIVHAVILAVCIDFGKWFR